MPPAPTGAERRAVGTSAEPRRRSARPAPLAEPAAHEADLQTRGVLAGGGVANESPPAPEARTSEDLQLNGIDERDELRANRYRSAAAEQPQNFARLLLSSIAWRRPRPADSAFAHTGRERSMGRA